MQVQDRPKDPVSLWSEPGVLDHLANQDQIDRRGGLSVEQFHAEYSRKERPVIITDALTEWKAMGTWTPETLKERYGSALINIGRQRVAFGELIDESLARDPDQPARYSYTARLTDLSPDVMDDVSPPLKYWSPNWLADILHARTLPLGLRQLLQNLTILGLRVGGTGSHFHSLHYDVLRVQALSSQIYGRKEWVVYPPDQSPFLYPTQYPTQRDPAISGVPLDRPVDLAEFPLFEQARPLRFTVEEGETLFLPAGWWHTTRPLSPSIAVLIGHADATVWSGVVKETFDFVKRRWPRRRAVPAAIAYAG